MEASCDLFLLNFLIPWVCSLHSQAIIKPQYVDHIPKAVQGNVGQVLEQKDERDMKTELCIDLGLNQVIDRNVGELSGGELQRFAIAAVSIQNAQIYMFDEPSTYLDVKQTLKAAKVIRSLLRPSSYVIIVEHDLSVLDYLSDFICCLYGTPGVYGVVTMPFSVREGINIFLAGFVPTENLRFRNESLTFKIPETEERAQETETYQRYKYPTMSKPLGNFKLNVVEGEFTDCQIVVMLVKMGPEKLHSSKCWPIAEYHDRHLSADLRNGIPPRDTPVRLDNRYKERDDAARREYEDERRRRGYVDYERDNRRQPHLEDHYRDRRDEGRHDDRYYREVCKERPWIPKGGKNDSDKDNQDKDKEDFQDPEREVNYIHGRSTADSKRQQKVLYREVHSVSPVLPQYL
ncbi:hypothetical protein PR202_gb23785 [Eleusine coracana subsp. coracana]|uniref:ABC transporter domain-containing protein n=1 Tax=Eleusine coracana subsp. coracana TaxID=191504 RepID=A0AAV5FJB4_ELECO|nr:hypothetical protein PR202_gb23785 [Eleusine coracana subsp. coracana]